jgi:lipopolysaccharide transport protein LptA
MKQLAGRGRQAGQVSGYDGERPRWLQARVAALLICVAMAATVRGADEVPLAPLEDLVFVRARTATQSIAGDRFDAAGDLLLRSDDWTIRADTAVIEGSLADPSEIEVSGAPARIVYQDDDATKPLEGESSRLWFRPRAEEVVLEGNARVVRGARSVSSESIRYLLGRDVFSAGRSGRVRVVTTPD